MDSNLTRWPWYSNVAPVSWLVQTDVDEGRRELNLSTDEVEVEEMIETIREGSMPPWQYKPTHPGAWLSEQEKRELIRGLAATFGAGGAESGEKRGRRRGRVIRPAARDVAGAAAGRRRGSRLLVSAAAIRVSSGCVACARARGCGCVRAATHVLALRGVRAGACCTLCA
jgi:hypothetical protein